MPRVLNRGTAYQFLLRAIFPNFLIEPINFFDVI